MRASWAAARLGAAVNDHAGGWLVPRDAQLVVDREYVLAPAGPLAADYPKTALALLRGLPAAS